MPSLSDKALGYRLSRITMVKVGRILWTTDGSKEAKSALNYARLFANAFNSEIIGLHIIQVFDKKIWGLLGEKADLIVMNTHGRKGIKRFVLGSVAEKVIQESSCSVLALKP